jgi:4-hydroxybenzoate polyprenyltransferase
MTAAQDFRDVAGDKVAGRRTVPLMIYDTNARLLAAAGFVLWSAVSCWCWGVGFVTWKVGVGVWVAALHLIASLFCDRGHRGNVFTWKLYTVWLLSVSALPLLVAQAYL